MAWDGKAISAHATIDALTECNLNGINSAEKIHGAVPHKAQPIAYIE